MNDAAFWDLQEPQRVTFEKTAFFMQPEVYTFKRKTKIPTYFSKGTSSKLL
jgi:hypothetical protein